MNKFKKFSILLEELESKVIYFNDYLEYGYPVYRVIYDYNVDYVTGNDEGEALDNLIDYLWDNGFRGCFIDVLEYEDDYIVDIEDDVYYPDTYIIGGDRGLVLYHGGNFMIDRVL